MGYRYMLLPLILMHNLGTCCAADFPTLRVIHVFFRHGQRSPLASYPTDPYNNMTYWPNGWAQLTNFGKLQTYELAQRIRSTYNNFIPKDFKNDDMHMYSTDKSRTLMSAQTFLAGLYPPDKHQQWLKDLQWQPIPVHTISALFDPLYPLAKCPAGADELHKVQQLPEAKKLADANLISYIKEKTGEKGPVLMVPNLYMLHDTLRIQAENNMTLPEWTKRVYPDKLAEITKFTYKMFVRTPLLKRLRVGGQLAKVTSVFQSYRNKTLDPTSRRIYLYSVHEWNIMLMAEVLGLFEPYVPPYAIALIFELHEISDGQFAVKFMYFNGKDPDPARLVMPKCPDPCSLDKFLDITLPFTPTDWKAECRSSPSHNEKISTSKQSCHYITDMLLLICLLFATCMLMYY